MIRRLLAAVLLLTASPAFAGSGTYTPPGVGFTFQETTNASGYFYPNISIWDYSAGANGLGVNADHSLNAALVPETSGGLLISRTVMTASTNATLVKNAAGQVYHVAVTCNSTLAANQYLRIYNLSSAPTCSSATGLVDGRIVPWNAGGAGFVEDIGEGIAFGTGIGYCFTGALGDTDTTNATASACTVSFYYK